VSRLTVACLAVTGSLAVAGCGYDATELEESITDRFGAELERLDLRIESVSCPDEIDDEAGYEFQCTISAESGEEIPVSAEVTEDGEVEYGFSKKTERDLAFGEFGRTGGANP
jgi:hypothetical protein